MDSSPSSASVPSPRRGPWTGRTLAGKYLVGDLIGEGGLSQVYSALQLDLDREVAVKVLVESADDDTRERFLRETKIAAGIRHPCVAQIFDAGVDADGQRYLAMELLEGETLKDRIERGPLGAAEAVAIVAGLCLALQAVHDKGFLHRDVKPSNVFLAQRPDGGADPKLIDFGIAKRVAVSDETRRRCTTMRGLGKGGAAKGDAAPTAFDIIVGTPLYLSPEQIVGDTLDARSDVYSLAVTLYEAIAGTPPFADGEMAELLAKIVTQAPAPLARVAPEAGVPAALDREILRALSKDPAARPASAADFAAALWGALADARHPSDPTISPAPARGRRWIAVAIGVAAALASLTVVLVRQGLPPAVPAPPATTSVPAAVASAPAPPEAPPPAPEPTAGDARAAAASLRPRTNGAPPARPPSRPTPTRSPAPATTAAPSPESFRVDDLKPVSF